MVPATAAGKQKEENEKNQASLENMINLSFSYLGQISCDVLQSIEIMLHVLRCHKFMFTFNHPNFHRQRGKNGPQ